MVAHVRVRHRAGENFVLEKIQGHSFASIESLIEGCAQKLNLRKPCPGRKYEYCIFEHISDEMKSLHEEWMLTQSNGGVDKMELSNDEFPTN